MPRPALRILSAVPLLLAGLWTMPAAAEIPHAPQLVADSILADQRGGFDLAGMSINLGAQLSTYLNGQLALQTTLNWGDTATSTTVGGQADAARAISELSGAGFTAVPGDSVAVANGGQTVVLQGAAGGLQNVLLNSASGVVARQNIDATLSIKGYAPFEAGVVSGQMSSQIMSMMAAVLDAHH